MSKRKFDDAANIPIEMSEKSTSLCKSILSEDGALKYDFMISLQKIAMAKIVTILFIRSLFMNGNIAQHIGRNLITEMDFENKISALNLPSTFTRTLIKVFESVKRSAVSWITYHNRYIFTGVDENLTYLYIKKIKFNSRGRLDYGETAKNILATGDNCLSDEHKYRVACTYCLEDEIAVLAPKVVHDGYLDGVISHKNRLVYFWTAHITGDRRKFPIISFFSRFNDYNRCLNEVSIRYMWNRLSAEEKPECISSFILNYNCRDFNCSLLSTMNYEQQHDVFRKHSFWMLQCMMDDWLWEEYFLPTALHVLNIMESNDFALLLREILFKIRHCQGEGGGLCKQCIYRFKLLWSEAPMHLKDFGSEDMQDYALRELIGVLAENSDWIPVDLYETVLKDFNAEQKKNFIFGDIRFLGAILSLGKFDMADCLIKCCEASPEEINDLKNKLMLSNNMKYFEFCFHTTKKDILPLVIKWWNPSKETVGKLKEKFKNEYFPIDLCKLLYAVIENQNCLNLAGDK